MPKPLDYERRTEIRYALGPANTEFDPAQVVDQWMMAARDLLIEVDRVHDLFEKLAAAVGRLDFDRSESALPQTQEQWIEFVREIDGAAQKIVDRFEDGDEES